MTPTPLDNPAEKLGGIVTHLYELAGNSSLAPDQRRDLLLKAHDLRGALRTLVAMQFTQATDAYTQTMAGVQAVTAALKEAGQDIQKVIDVISGAAQLAASIDNLLKEAAQIAATIGG